MEHVAQSSRISYAEAHSFEQMICLQIFSFFFSFFFFLLMHQTTVTRKRKQNWQFVHLDIRPSLFLIATLYFPHIVLQRYGVLHAFLTATERQSSLLLSMHSISYNISYMQCLVTFFFFFHSTRETLFNRECESEWLIHKWDPDSGSENTDTTVGCVVRVATTSGCLMPAKTHRSIGFRFHDTAPAKMHVEGGPEGLSPGAL